MTLLATFVGDINFYTDLKEVISGIFGSNVVNLMFRHMTGM